MKSLNVNSKQNLPLLVRRSFFVYVNEEMSEDALSSISAMLANERIAEDKAIKSRESVIEYINEITEPLLELAGTTVDISEEVRDTFSLYKKYNEAIANTIDGQFPIAVTIQVTSTMEGS